MVNATGVKNIAIPSNPEMNRKFFLVHNYYMVRLDDLYWYFTNQ